MEYIRESHPDSWRLQRSHFTSGQLNETRDVFKQLEVWGAYLKDGSTDKYQRRVTENEKKYRKEILDKVTANLVLTIMKKFSEIDVLLCSHQNDATVKDELSQMSDIFKLIEDINQQMIELDDIYTEELWFTNTVEKVFSFKHKVHN